MHMEGTKPHYLDSLHLTLIRVHYPYVHDQTWISIVFLELKTRACRAQAMAY